MIGNKNFNLKESSNSIFVSTVAEMKKLKLAINKTSIQTLGYTNENDKGDALYYFDKESSETADDFSIIQPNNNVGRFKLIYKDEINIATAGVIIDSITDNLAKIQKVIDFISSNGGGKIIFNNGTYYVSDTIILKQYVKLVGNTEKAVYLPAQKPEIKALNTFPVGKAIIDLGDGNSNRRGMQVLGLTINGNLTAEKGINFSDTIQNEVKENLFINIKTDGVALWGGGALYLNIEKNSFSTGDWYALDSQKNYSYNPSGHYYGINVGNFAKNNVTCTYGIRHEGILDIYENDFEMAVKKRACVDINSATANSYTNIFNNYFELTQDYVPLTAIRCASNSGFITGNRINGQNGLANSIAIDIGSNYNYSINVHSNSIVRWGIGIKSFSSGGGHGDNIINYSIGNNFYNFVTTYISNSTNYNTVNSSANADDYKHTAQIINKGNHYAFQNAISLGTCSTNYTSATKLNLVKGNLFKITDTIAVTISTVTNKTRGFLFSIFASSNNIVTLDNSVFNLSCGSNFLLPANLVLMFEVDYDGNIKEVGCTSSLFFNSTAPVDAINPVGYINIGGKKIPYFN